VTPAPHSSSERAEPAWAALSRWTWPRRPFHSIARWVVVAAVWAGVVIPLALMLARSWDRIFLELIDYAGIHANLSGLLRSGLVVALGYLVARRVAASSEWPSRARVGFALFAAALVLLWLSETKGGGLVLGGEERAMWSYLMAEAGKSGWPRVSALAEQQSVTFYLPLARAITLDSGVVKTANWLALAISGLLLSDLARRWFGMRAAAISLLVWLALPVLPVFTVRISSMVPGLLYAVAYLWIADRAQQAARSRAWKLTLAAGGALGLAIAFLQLQTGSIVIPVAALVAQAILGAAARGGGSELESCSAPASRWPREARVLGATLLVPIVVALLAGAAFRSSGLAVNSLGNAAQQASGTADRRAGQHAQRDSAEVSVEISKPRKKRATDRPGLQLPGDTSGALHSPEALLRTYLHNAASQFELLDREPKSKPRFQTHEARMYGLVLSSILGALALAALAKFRWGMGLPAHATLPLIFAAFYSTWTLVIGPSVRGGELVVWFLCSVYLSPWASRVLVRTPSAGSQANERA
jgi:hypothetical protein